MTNKFFPFALLLCLGSTFIGCATNRPVMLGAARPAINPGAVRVYEYPPRRFESIAVIEGESVPDLRYKAAALGANGIVIGGVINRSGPTIGVGVGTSSYGYGRRSAVGIGTGVSFAVPTGGQALEATAIYVR